MITREDWEVVLTRLTAEEREALGPPPTVEEMLAFDEGTLSPEETERVRRLLVAYPDFAHALAQPILEDDEPLPAAELDRRWTEFQRTLPRREEGGRLLFFWRVSASLAAALAIALGGLLWQARHDLSRPHVIGDERLLQQDGQRGGAEVPLAVSAGADWYLLTVPIIGAEGYEDYRLDIHAPGAAQPAWRSGVLSRRSNDAFAIVVPRRFLATTGTYQVVLYGVRGGGEERLATYSLRVPGHRQAP
ncbi:MAG TPA: hypothetical protein VH087_10320 [Thermoanaerobaculia bacterium]|jgi:hypothetical protein|nr:hypothetical protein [Thermoanaerobaculia bacterium]